MQNQLKVTVIQADLVWEDKIQNLQNFEKEIGALEMETDLIILPEMFTTGFSMNPEKLAETMDGDTVKWMQNTASKKQSALLGSVIVKESNRFYNRLIFVRPSGEVEVYDKRHLFSLAGEEKEYTAGTRRLIVDYKGWKICPLVCYDLRFPVWSRNTVDYDVLIYVANWPKPRIAAWDTLLKARAIENMSYCIGVNRVGVDINNYEYPGHTVGFDVLGTKICETTAFKEEVKTIILEKKHIKETRKRFQFLNDKD